MDAAVDIEPIQGMGRWWQNRICSEAWQLRTEILYSKTMRTVHLTITLNAIVQMDEGVEVSEMLDQAEPTLKLPFDSVTEIDCQIVNHEVTDSR